MSAGETDTPPSPFTHLAIIGMGLIGGSVALAARRSFPAVRITAVDPNPETRRSVLESGCADAAIPDLSPNLAEADLVVLATPVPAIRETLPRLSSLLSSSAMVTDVGSVKGAVSEIGWQHLGARFVPGHPMAGSEKHGFGAARADLFSGATWVLIPSGAPEQAPVLERVAGFVRGLGAVPLLLNSDEHDACVALTSHVPHVAAYMLYAQARQQGPDSPVWKLAAGGFHSATRVAASSPELWTGICLSNRDNVASVLRDLAQRLLNCADALETSDREHLLSLFQQGHRTG
ncbi:MAG: prephenate dehydrogenase [Armatimonadaceae bacterium]